MKLQIDQLQQRFQATVVTVRQHAQQQGQALRTAGKRPEATVRRVIASGRSSLDGLVQSADVAKQQLDQRLSALQAAVTKFAQHPVVQQLATSALGAKIVTRLPASVSQLLTPPSAEQSIE